mmetsp:Transcript_115970/g.249173  ORF Transcript_115970/g.249173 Transcript_115970/m.249173 type:complete len:204 (-) Transcript_115970:741-1352(-)
MRELDLEAPLPEALRVTPSRVQESSAAAAAVLLASRSAFGLVAAAAVAPCTTIDSGPMASSANGKPQPSVFVAASASALEAAAMAAEPAGLVRWPPQPAPSPSRPTSRAPRPKDSERRGTSIRTPETAMWPETAAAAEADALTASAGGPLSSTWLAPPPPPPPRSCAPWRCRAPRSPPAVRPRQPPRQHSGPPPAPCLGGSRS